MSARIPLTLAHSPDPDDAFMWWPLTGMISPDSLPLPGDVGRPALDGTTLLYDYYGRIAAVDLTTMQRTILRREPRAQLRGPSLLNGRLVYVRATYRRQQVMTGPPTPQSTREDKALWGTVPTGRRDAGEEGGKHKNAPGHHHDLWPRPQRGVADTLTTTATAADAVYVTRLRQRKGTPLEAAVLRIAPPSRTSTDRDGP